MSFTEDPRFSESFNLSENSVTTPEDAEPLKYHADQGGEEELSEQEEAPKKTRGRVLLGVLGAAATTALVILSGASDDADIDEGGVTREAATGEKGAAPSGDQGAANQGAYDGGGDYGTGTGGGEYMPQGASGDVGGGAFAGGPQTPAAPPPTATNGSAPPPNPAP
jgi:hypothetical protein